MIVVRIYEGLGNQMFEYAYAYALNERMKKKGIRVYLDMREEAVTLFDTTRYYRPSVLHKFRIGLPAASEEMLRHWNYLSEKTMVQKAICRLADLGKWKYKRFKEHEFNYRKEHLKIKNYTYAEGWFQHDQYFQKYRNSLLKEFTLKEKWEIPKQLQDILNDYQVISVHVRRGDYVSDPAVKRSMGICGKDYYLKAVDYLKERIRRPYLFLFTNDAKWVEEHLKFDVPHTVISNQFGLSDIQEMMLMSRCNHNIIANSTFSWWGAWLNTHEDKIVIAPKRWFMDRTRKNIAMKDWIKM